LALKKTREPWSTLNHDIINVAERLFKEHGYDHTTFQMIAEELGVTKGAIVYHFKNKHRILHSLFENFFNLLHDHIRVNLKDGFNYYLYYCIFYIYVSREIVKNENNYRLFYHKDYVGSWEREKLLDVEESYRLITNDFNKDFTKEELRLATIMDMGARTHLFKEFTEGDGTITIEKYSYYRVYLIGVLSRLDEATIEKNIQRAFDFVDGHVAPSIFLLT
jgi:AcrR family transcriptional regulator